MKKLPLLSLLLLLIPAISFTQHINGLPLDSITSPYIEIAPYSMPGSSVTLLVDYGQPVSIERAAVLKDESDTPVRFNSMIDAINYFHTYGYALDHVFVTGETSGNVSYILKKKDRT
jgi:hypothetical protein